MGKQVLRSDKTRNKQVSIQLVSKLRRLEHCFIRSNKLRSPSYTILMVLFETYCLTGNGMTVYQVSKIINPSNTRGEIVATNSRVKGLLLDSLIEISGYGRYASHIYIPTQRVLKELQEMCDKINEG